MFFYMTNVYEYLLFMYNLLFIYNLLFTQHLLIKIYKSHT